MPSSDGLGFPGGVVPARIFLQKNFDFSYLGIDDVSIQCKIEDTTDDNETQTKTKGRTMEITIKQAIEGSSYYEATTNEGTIARESLQELKRVLSWIYSLRQITFKVELADIPHRELGSRCHRCNNCGRSLDGNYEYCNSCS